MLLVDVCGTETQGYQPPPSASVNPYPYPHNTALSSPPSRFLSGIAARLNRCRALISHDLIDKPTSYRRLDPTLMSNTEESTTPPIVRRIKIPRKMSSTTSPTYWRVGALYGAAAVCLGAFGAHGLKSRISDPAKIASWNTAAQYHVTSSPFKGLP